MPLAVNPNKRYVYVLESDRGIEKEKQPTFIFRYLTGLEQMDIADRLNNVGKQSSEKERMQFIFNIVATGLVGWENMVDLEGRPITFELDRMPSFLTIGEAFELAYAAMQQGITIEDKKKLDSQSDSSSAKSAETVPA
jgi:hypothetical protein